MTTSLLLLASLAPGPATPPVQGLISADDYPAASLNLGEEGPVAMEILVDPAGAVDTCKIAISSGFKRLDDTSCRIVKTRARFTPAQRADGVSIYGRTRAVITWRISGVGSGASLAPDLELSLNKAPEGVSLPADVQLSYIVGTDGRVRECKSVDQPVKAPEQLTEIACGETGGAPIEVVRSKGVVVEAMDSIKVHFALKP